MALMMFLTLSISYSQEITTNFCDSNGINLSGTTAKIDYLGCKAKIGNPIFFQDDMEGDNVLSKWDNTGGFYLPQYNETTISGGHSLNLFVTNQTEPYSFIEKKNITQGNVPVTCEFRVLEGTFLAGDINDINNPRRGSDGFCVNTNGNFSAPTTICYGRARTSCNSATRYCTSADTKGWNQIISPLATLFLNSPNIQRLQCDGISNCTWFVNNTFIFGGGIDAYNFTISSFMLQSNFRANISLSSAQNSARQNFYEHTIYDDFKCYDHTVVSPDLNKVTFRTVSIPAGYNNVDCQVISNNTADCFVSQDGISYVKATNTIVDFPTTQYTLYSFVNMTADSDVNYTSITTSFVPPPIPPINLGIRDTLSEAGNGIGILLTAITNPLGSLIFYIGMIGGMIALLVGIVFTIRKLAREL